MIRQPAVPARRRRAHPLAHYCLLVFCLLASAGVNAQSRAKKSEPPPATQRGATGAVQSADALHELSDLLAGLAARVSPAVVQILVTGYGVLEEGNRSDTALVGRQRSIGSGVVVDREGYIVTNAHVVEGAQRIRVMLTGASADSRHWVTPIGKRAVFEAGIIGVHKDTDLALLKVDAGDLSFLPLDYAHRVRQGQLVIALGNPEGLENSVSLGVVSAVARQPDPDRPGVYIQTDAPINPGNSGGPLVDVDGRLVGINTFILTQGGGSEGLGFAIPARVVKFVYDELRQHGHVHRSEIGASAQTITHLMAAGLGLSRSWGVIISNVVPGGPADAAGLKVQDIVLSMDDRGVDTLPVFENSLYLHASDELLKLEVLRGSERLTLQIPVVEQRHDIDRLADIVDPDKSLIPKFGILAIDLNEKILKALPDVQTTAGVLVAARAAAPGSTDTGLSAGDLIRALNLTPVASVQDLRRLVERLKPGDAVVLQIERQSRLQYLAFEME